MIPAPWLPGGSGGASAAAGPVARGLCRERELRAPQREARAGLCKGSSAGAHLPLDAGCGYTTPPAQLPARAHPADVTLPGSRCRGAAPASGVPIPPAFLHPARCIPASPHSSQPAWGLPCCRVSCWAAGSEPSAPLRGDRCSLTWGTWIRASLARGTWFSFRDLALSHNLAQPGPSSLCCLCLVSSSIPLPTDATRQAGMRPAARSSEECSPNT